MEVARIRAARSDLGRLRKDAEALCRQALEEGAEDACVIACKDLRFRKSKRAGTGRAQTEPRPSLHWPSPSYPLDSLREALGRYRLAVAFRLPLPQGGPEQQREALEKLYRLVSRLESACFYKGYHLALGLASGNCRDFFCSSESRCQATIKGKPCLHPNKARPSIEACGLDPAAIAASLKRSPSPKSAHQVFGGFLGLVFVDGALETAVKKTTERNRASGGRREATAGPGSAPQDPMLANRLQELLSVAVAAGASDAKVISSEDVVLDPRVRLKCLIPRCSAAGTCIHCPPDGLSLRQTAETVSRYRKGIFFRVVVQSEIVSGPAVSEGIARKGPGDKAALMLLGAYYLLVLQIVALLERKARQWGYEPAGYGAGTCRDVLCLFQPHCRALLTTRGCRHPDLSRPSMESCGMDVYTMGANVGWDIYPVGGSVRPEDVPKGSLMGLVLVA